MNVRFFTALAIALTIFAIHAGASWAREPRSVVDVTYAVAPMSPADAAATVQLPEVVVRPSRAQLAWIAAERAQTTTQADARAAIAGAKTAIAGRVKERVSRVSVLVPYYAFGGARLRATE